MTQALHDDAVAVLSQWAAPDREQAALRDGYMRFLAEHPGEGVLKSGAEHLTASTLVVAADASAVLLTLHAKGRIWVQTGGHLEAGDLTIAAAALREAAEETGIEGLRLLAGPCDLDRHALASAFGTCRLHLDVRYVAVAPEAAEHSRTAESLDLRWFAPDALPDAADASVRRLVAAGVALVRAA